MISQKIRLDTVIAVLNAHVYGDPGRPQEHDVGRVLSTTIQIIRL